MRIMQAVNMMDGIQAQIIGNVSLAVRAGEKIATMIVIIAKISPYMRTNPHVDILTEKLFRQLLLTKCFNEVYIRY